MFYGYTPEDIVRAWSGLPGGPTAAQQPVLGCDGHDHPQMFLPDDKCEICAYIEAHDLDCAQEFLQLRCVRHARPVIVSTDHASAPSLRLNPDDRLDLISAIEWDPKDAQVIIGKDDFGTANRLGHFRIHVTLGVPYETMPEELMLALKHEAQEASKWFFPDQYPDFDYPPVVTRRPISDEEVRDRIQGYQYGIDREIARYTHYRFEGGWTDWRWRADWRKMHRAWVIAFKKWSQSEAAQSTLDTISCHRIDLEALPWIIQRALVTRWERCWEPYEGRFEPHVGFFETPGYVVAEPAGEGRTAYFWFEEGGN